MRLYFAPMEGVTGSVHRSAHHQIFGHVDKYYAPFIFTNPNGKISSKDRMELEPEYNEGCMVVPQLLSNCAGDFIATARTLKAMGYEEVNLNLGCPSQTVVSKGRGAGFLGYPAKLRAFLSEIFESLDMKISVKTRIGLDEPEEFEELLEIYGHFPISELMIHPRLRNDFYKGKTNLSAFEQGLERSKAPVCYNGDLFTVRDFLQMQERYPQVDGWMIGRGALADPALFREICGGKSLEREELQCFHEAVRAGYDIRLGGNIKVIFLMKELWRYFRYVMSEEDQVEVGRLLHINDRMEFLKTAEQILAHCSIIKGQGFTARNIIC